jgi:hypothetical protein
MPQRSKRFLIGGSKYELEQGGFYFLDSNYEPHSDDPDGGDLIDISSKSFTDSVPQATLVYDSDDIFDSNVVVLSTGLNVIVGATGSGKTALLHFISAQEILGARPKYVAVAEFSKPGINAYLPSAQGVISAFDEWSPTDVQCLIIDSLSSILGAGGGAAMTGGITRDVNAYLAAMDMIARSANLCIVVTLNPLVSRESNAYTGLLGLLLGSCSTVVEVMRTHYNERKRDHLVQVAIRVGTRATDRVVRPAEITFTIEKPSKRSA